MSILRAKKDLNLIFEGHLLRRLSTIYKGELYCVECKKK